MPHEGLGPQGRSLGIRTVTMLTEAVVSGSFSSGCYKVSLLDITVSNTKKVSIWMKGFEYKSLLMFNQGDTLAEQVDCNVWEGKRAGGDDSSMLC